jgi:DNA-binding HxlR family transcriptional regulator
VEVGNKMIPEEWAPLVGRKGMPKIVGYLLKGPQRPKLLIEKSKLSRPSFYQTLNLLQENHLVRPSHIIEGYRSHPAYEFTSEGYEFAKYVTGEEE